MGERVWTVAEAQENLDEVMDLAENEGPQTVVENGPVVAVIVAATEWEALNK